MGKGYGFATAEGQAAVALWDTLDLNPLDTTYSGKAGAAFVAGARQGVEGANTLLVHAVQRALACVDQRLAGCGQVVADEVASQS